MENTSSYARELIEKVRELSPKSEMSSLLNDLERFLQLQEELSKDPKDTKAGEKLHEMRDQMWSSFEKVTEVMGVTPEALQEHFGDEDNFSEEQWVNIQRIQGEMGAPQKRAAIKHKIQTKA